MTQETNWETEEAHLWLSNTDTAYDRLMEIREKRPIRGYQCKRVAENHLGDRFGNDYGLSVNNSRIRWGKVAEWLNEAITKETCARCGKETVYWTRSDSDGAIICRECDRAERGLLKPAPVVEEPEADERSDYERGFNEGYEEGRYGYVD